VRDHHGVGTPYFAYGSNIDELVVDGRPAPMLGVASLEDHRLAFMRRSVRTGTGVADAIPAAGERVWGVLYEVGPEIVAELDRKEGAGWAYVRAPVRVRRPDGAEVDAFLYTVLHKEPSEVAPSAAYLARLVRGARRRGLPEAYVRKLELLQVDARPAEARGG
jgi:gamma-glutamylcyclotransferase (GGCT)/AIG2-like uncharacterized protein YtfP